MPYFSLGYSDGIEVAGGGGWSVANNYFRLGGSNRLRQVFIVEGPTRRVNGVWFRLGRAVDTTAPLYLEIKDARGSRLLSRSVPASQVSVGSMSAKENATPVKWIYANFLSIVSLQSGSRYSIELSSSGRYSMQAYVDAVRHGFTKDRNAWSSAQAEISRDGGASWSGRIEQSNLDFGFAFTLYGGPKSIH